MRSLVVIRSYPSGPRVWVAGQRLHHGATGCVLVAGVMRFKRLRALALVGMLLAAHDRRDWRIWFVRESIPAREELSQCN